MSDAFYNDMADVATELLTEFGATVSVSRTTGGSVNPVTGVITAGTTTTLTAKGIVTTYRADLIDGSTIQHNDRLLILDSSFEPLMTDRPVIGNQQWNIIAIETKQPANVAITYRCQVRK